LALAEYYSQLAERELVAAKRLEAPAGPQIQANTLPAAPRDGSLAVQRDGTLGLIDEHLVLPDATQQLASKRNGW
jgi:hypothetical protein